MTTKDFIGPTTDVLRWNDQLSRGNTYPFVIKASRMLSDDEIRWANGLCESMIGPGGPLPVAGSMWTVDRNQALYSFKRETDRTMFILGTAGSAGTA